MHVGVFLAGGYCLQFSVAGDVGCVQPGCRCAAVLSNIYNVAFLSLVFFLS